jgi:hypothetical protein
MCGLIAPKPGSSNLAATSGYVPPDRHDHDGFGHDHRDRRRHIAARQLLRTRQPHDQRQPVNAARQISFDNCKLKTEN